MFTLIELPSEVVRADPSGVLDETTRSGCFRVGTLAIFSPTLRDLGPCVAEPIGPGKYGTPRDR